MEISNVRIYKNEREGSRVKAFVKVDVDDALTISNIRIIEGENRVFCAMPNHKVKDEKWEDVVYPKNQEARDYLEKVILDEYKKVEE